MGISGILPLDDDFHDTFSFLFISFCIAMAHDGYTQVLGKHMKRSLGNNDMGLGNCTGRGIGELAGSTTTPVLYRW